MTDHRNDKQNAAAAEEILRQIEAFGADTSRWPKAAGDAALRDPSVAKELREAAAFDRLLAMAAPKTRASDAALVDRIVVAAERTPRVVTQPAVSAAHATAAPVATDATPDNRVVPFQRPVPVSRSWGSDLRRGFAVLAASLVLGLSIGQSGMLDRALLGFEDLTGVPVASVSQDIAGALTDDAGGEDY